MNNKPIAPVKYVASLTLALAFGFFSQATADVQSRIIREHSDELQCAADEMKNEIKAHFKGTRMYGKLLGINAQIKGRSAAVERRIKRDPCYRLMDRDLKKLDELACELNSIYQEALVRDAKCEGRPIRGNTLHVHDQIINMNEIVDCMLAAAKGGVTIGYVPVEVPPVEFNHAIQGPFRGAAPTGPRFPSSPYGNEFEPYRPGIDFAPGEIRLSPQRGGHSVLSR